MHRRSPAAVLFCSILLSTLSAYAQVGATVEVFTKIMQAIGGPEVVNKLFDKLMQHKTPEQKAREPLRNLYEAFLQLKYERGVLYRAILNRLDEERSSPKAFLGTETQFYYEVSNAEKQTATALQKLQRVLNEMRTDLDYHEPKFSETVTAYTDTSTQSAMLRLGIDPGNRAQMLKLKKEMEMNDKPLDDALNRLRALTKKYYPKLGDLMK